MTEYVCKFHIYRTNQLFSRKECADCTPDIINNKNCQNYAPVSIADFEKLKGRFFKAVEKIEERPEWKIKSQLRKLERLLK
jgi:hypothetical protein